MVLEPLDSSIFYLNTTSLLLIDIVRKNKRTIIDKFIHGRIWVYYGLIFWY